MACMQQFGTTNYSSYQKKYITFYDHPRLRASSRAPERKKPRTIVRGFVNRIGFEPMACCLEGSCSIQLSYRSNISNLLFPFFPKAFPTYSRDALSDRAISPF